MWNKLWRQYGPALVAAIRTALAAHQAQVVDAAKKARPIPKATPDLAIILAEGLAPVYVAAYEELAPPAAPEVAEYRDLLLDAIAQSVKDINETTRRQVAEKVWNWIERGAPLDELAADLAPVFGPARAERIAVTEVTNALALGTEAAGQAAKDTYPGVNVEKVWHTAADDLVCPICAPLNNQTAPLDGYFTVPTGPHAGTIIKSPAAHPNCRCTISLQIRK